MKRTGEVKDIVLICLVGISIFLTTQIWLDVSFWKSSSTAAEKVNSSEEIQEYEITSLLKPFKIAVNGGEESNHILISMGESSYSMFESITEESKKIFTGYFRPENMESKEVVNLDAIYEIRKEKGLELIFKNEIPIELVAALLEIQPSMLEGIEVVNELIILPKNKEICAVDIQNSKILKVKMKNVDTNIEYIIDAMRNYKKTFCIFNNHEDPNRYGIEMTLPITTADIIMPILESKGEITTDKDINKVINTFFKDVESKSIIDQSGATIYTDGQNKALRIEKNGAIEFIRSDVEAKDKKSISVEGSFDIAIKFIHNTMGLPQGAYLEKVTPIYNRNKEIAGYSFKIGYCINNTPIVMEGDRDKAPIEIEVIGKEVRSHQRNVKIGLAANKEITTLKALDVLNIILGSKIGDEEELVIEEMYLAYHEYENFAGTAQLIPVWTVRFNSKSQGMSQIVVNAETGIILKY